MGGTSVSPAKAAPSVFAPDISRPGIPRRSGLGSGCIQRDVETEQTEVAEFGDGGCVGGVSSGTSCCLEAGVCTPEFREVDEDVRNDDDSIGE